MLVEVKLGYTPEVIEHAADTLKRFAGHLDDDPALVVITSGGPALRRSDGVAVIPIGALGP